MANDVPRHRPPEFGRRRPKRGGGTLEGLGFRLRCTIRCALWPYGELVRWRVGWWGSPGLGWLESTTASSVAATGVRLSTGEALRLADEQTEVLGST